MLRDGRMSIKVNGCRNEIMEKCCTSERFMLQTYRRLPIRPSDHQVTVRHEQDAIQDPLAVPATPDATLAPRYMHPSPAHPSTVPQPSLSTSTCAILARETLQHTVSAAAFRPLRRPLFVILPLLVLQGYLHSSHALSAHRSASLPPLERPCLPKLLFSRRASQAVNRVVRCHLVPLFFARALSLC